MNGADGDAAGAVTALLPDCQAEFVVVSDTHLVDRRADHAGEFASRLRQNGRVDAALTVAAGLGLPVLHLGDLVQDYPESALHEGLLERAVGQWRGAVDEISFVAGNTDVGDPHDPASPAPAVTEETMHRFARITGGSWCVRDIGPVRAIGLAASLFNSGLELEAQQWQWLQDELERAGHRRVVLFFHYPVFLRSPHDPDVGHNDVINEPARARLIEIIERHAVQAVFTGHSHFAFFNRVGPARLHGTPSTSFTRPGFSELFSSAAPPDRGRDDVPKLGMLLARVHPDRIRVHPVRTGTLADREAPARPVVSCVPADLPASTLGVVLRHPLAGFAEVPDVFPSVVRQPVRNDYPLLACLELGARQVSVPIDEVADPERAQRLQVSRDEGVHVTARLICPAGREVSLPDLDAPVDALELVLLDRPAPDAADLSLLRRAGETRPVRLSTLIREHRAAAELPRWRYGFTADEAVAAGRLLDGVGSFRMLLCGAEPGLLDQAGTLTAEAAGNGMDGVDVVIPVPPDASAAAGHLAEAFLAVCALPVGAVLFDGLTELDRTLDLSSGLLDRACNPQPAFHALRILNSLVYGGGPATISRNGSEFHVRRDRLHAIVHTTGTASPEGGDEASEVIDLSCGSTVTRADRPAGPWMILHRD